MSRRCRPAAGPLVLLPPALTEPTAIAVSKLAADLAGVPTLLVAADPEGDLDRRQLHALRLALLANQPVVVVDEEGLVLPPAVIRRLPAIVEDRLAWEAS